MTDQWDERTEAIPGKKDDKSIELDLDLVAVPPEDAAHDLRFLDTPSLVVFEPVPIGLAEAFARLGYRVRAGATGVDVMSAVAGAPPAAVLCAPGPDSERRRLLAAALRLRFPNVPVVYVSTHAAQEEAVLGAIREGARAVLAWPLPPAADVQRVLKPYLARAQPAHFDDRDTAPVPRIEEAAEQVHTARTPQVNEVHDLPSDAMRPLPVPLPLHPDEAAFVEPTTKPDVRRPRSQKKKPRGALGELMLAVSPFLWSLEDAARWAEALGDAGDEQAQMHARTLKAVARILAQVDERVEESGA